MRAHASHVCALLALLSIAQTWSFSTQGPLFVHGGGSSVVKTCSPPSVAAGPRSLRTFCACGELLAHLAMDGERHVEVEPQNEVQLVSTHNPKHKRKHWRATDHSGIYRIKPLHTYNR